jgi:hypothetical protein
MVSPGKTASPKRKRAPKPQSPNVVVNWASPSKSRSPGRPQNRPGSCAFHATLNGFMLSSLGRKLVAHYLKMRKNAGFVPGVVNASTCPAVGSGLFWSYVARWLAPGNATFHKGVNSNLLYQNTVHGNSNISNRPAYRLPGYVKKFTDKMFGTSSPVLVKRDSWSLSNRSPIQRIITNNSGTYKLSHAYVEGGLRFMVSPGNVIRLPHAICAYIKNGEERIFDSNAPHSVAFNWVDNPNHVRDWYRHFYWRQPYAKAEPGASGHLRANSSLQNRFGTLPFKETLVVYTLVYIKVNGNSNNINFG